MLVEQQLDHTEVAFVTAFPVNLITERQSQPNRLGAVGNRRLLARSFAKVSCMFYAVL